jgi:hypothetical protein
MMMKNEELAEARKLYSLQSKITVSNTNNYILNHRHLFLIGGSSSLKRIASKKPEIISTSIAMPIY